jgi:hypothetical protein
LQNFSKLLITIERLQICGKIWPGGGHSRSGTSEDSVFKVEEEMGPTLKIALAAGLVLVGSTNAEALLLPHPGSSAFEPVVPFLLTFDENGHATISVNGGPATPLTGVLIEDPSNPCPNCAPVLAYSLPEAVITGTVSIFEPAALGGGISEVLRFTDAAGTISGAATGAGPEMIYYSEAWLPENLSAGNFLAGPTEEVGANGYSEFEYQPGGVPYPGNNEYYYAGSGGAAVPEPASLTCLGGFIAAMGIMVRRRRWARVRRREADVC